jgi:hypothetical protein
MGAQVSLLCCRGDPQVQEERVIDHLKRGDHAESACRSLHAMLTRDGALAPQLVRQGAVQPLQKVVMDASSGSRARKDALETLALLALCYEGAMLVANPEFVSKAAKLLVSSGGGVRQRVGLNHYDLGVAKCLGAAAGDRHASKALLDAGGAAPAVALAGSPRGKVSMAGLQLLSRLADSRAAAAAIVEQFGAKQLAALLMLRFQAFTKKEDVDGSRAACFAIARVGQSEEFGIALARMEEGGLELIVQEIRREVPVVRSAAGYTLAVLGQHKHLRLQLIKKRCLQAFVDMAHTTSQRRDYADCQRVAALGFVNLCSTYHFRLAGAKAGVLDAIIVLLKADAMDVRRGAAQACAQLSLVEENSRRMCFGGALPPLFAMARSGDRATEREGILALDALSLSTENQQHMVREGLVHVLQYLASSDDGAASRTASKIMSRIRQERLRHAARMATKVKGVALSLGIGSDDGPQGDPQEANAGGGARAPEMDVRRQ